MKNNSRQSLSLALSVGPPWRLHDEDVGIANWIKRTRLMLAVFKIPFLVRRQGLAERCSNRFAQS